MPFRLTFFSSLSPLFTLPIPRATKKIAMPVSLLEEWWRAMPPVTRSYICISILTTTAVFLEFIHPLKLYLDWALVVKRAHVWRLFTNFFFFGPFDLEFLFKIYFLYRYCKMLETNSFRGRTADFLYMLLFGALVLTVLSPLAGVTFLAESLTFMMVYVWGRRNSRQAVNFLGILNFSAPYLPWVLLLLSLVFSSSANSDFLGILAGHVYYFMADVYPAMSGVTLLKTPRVLQFLVGNNDEYDHVYDAQDGIAPNARPRGAGWGQGRMLDGAARQ